MDPLDELKKDHSSILEQLYALDKQLGWLESSSPEKIPRIISSLSRISGRMWKDLTLHIRREERALYPVLEGRLGYLAEPVAIMRREHRQLLDCLSAVKSEISRMHQTLETIRTWGLNSKLQELRVGLSDHLSREERVVFWLAEVRLSEIDWRNISFEMLQIDKLHSPWKLIVPLPEKVGP